MDYESIGRAFESLQAHHLKKGLTEMSGPFLIAGYLPAEPRTNKLLGSNRVPSSAIATSCVLFTSLVGKSR